MAEAASERAARYMRILEAERTPMQDALRAGNAGMSRHKCDDIIDMAIGQVAHDSLGNGTNYTPDTAAELKAAVKEKIDQRLAQKPYKGWALGE